jgi:formylglycine-generating enzyme required for sulfatase activity
VDASALCVTESCSAAKGCSAVQNSVPCADGDLCTSSDQCSNGVCGGIQSPNPSCKVNLTKAAVVDIGCNSKITDNCPGDTTPNYPTSLSSTAIDAVEVTVNAFAACVAAGKCTEPAGGSAACTYGKSGKESHPINCVTWAQANAYCKWAYADGRLPTEAEWERAARSIDGRKYPWGNDEPTCNHANFTSSSGPCFLSTKPVGSYPAGKSADGIQDLAGNVREWVNDWYAADYYKTAPKQDPQGPNSGTERVVRGGSYRSDAAALLGWARDHATPDTVSPTIGFRCARSGM